MRQTHSIIRSRIVLSRISYGGEGYKDVARSLFCEARVDLYRVHYEARRRQSARRRGQSNQSRQFLRRLYLCPLCSTPHLCNHAHVTYL